MDSHGLPREITIILKRMILYSWSGRYKRHLRTLDNRRLYCLKQFQEERPDEDVLVLVQVVELNDFLQTFVSRMSEFGEGLEIRVRKNHKTSHQECPLQRVISESCRLVDF